jgi:hypothetical protein
VALAAAIWAALAAATSAAAAGTSISIPLA